MKGVASSRKPMICMYVFILLSYWMVFNYLVLSAEAVSISSCLEKNPTEKQGANVIQKRILNTQPVQTEPQESTVDNDNFTPKSDKDKNQIDSKSKTAGELENLIGDLSDLVKKLATRLDAVQLDLLSTKFELDNARHIAHETKSQWTRYEQSHRSTVERLVSSTAKLENDLRSMKNEREAEPQYTV